MKASDDCFGKAVEIALHGSSVIHLPDEGIIHVTLYITWLVITPIDKPYRI